MMLPIKNLLAPKHLYALCLGYTAVISILFLMPGTSVPKMDMPLDKVVHVSIHAGLFFLWSMFGLQKIQNRRHKFFYSSIAFLCLLYGIIIEVLQELFVPLRHADVMDIVANTAGLFLGIVLLYTYRKYFKKEK